MTEEKPKGVDWDYNEDEDATSSRDDSANGVDRQADAEGERDEALSPDVSKKASEASLTDILPVERSDPSFGERVSRILHSALGLAADETPFPWQERLLHKFIDGELPSALDIPTGLGKTATMAVWLVARALGAALPRRLVHVVDRRAVVDQASKVAEELRNWVQREPAVGEALGLGERPLPISTLRGQHVDNREWLEDPSSPAIVVGTVDMVGSRLLFSGYGVSSKMRPYHAGLLGADTLVVLDEAHLVPAFEDLLRQVERGTDLFGPKAPLPRALVPQFRLLSLSATGRQTDSVPLTLTDEDRRNPIVKKRLTAKKTLSIVELVTVATAPAPAEEGESVHDTNRIDEARKKDKGPKLAEVLAKQAWEMTAQGSARARLLVFCNARKDATAVAAELGKLAKSANAPEPTIELLVGGRRVLERALVVKWLVKHGFVEREDGTRAEPRGATFLVATSAGEVGVDMDADHMVCDLVAWERMVQRLGRVNRRGDGDAKVVVVVGEGAPDGDELRRRAEAANEAELEFRTANEVRKKQLKAVIDALTKDDRRNLELFEKQMKASDAGERLRASTGLSAAEKKKLKKALSAHKDSDAKKLAAYEAQIKQDRALRTLLTAVGIGGSLSPDALVKLRNRQELVDALREATTAEPLRPELTRPLVDAWSMTSLDDHTGRADVDPWLRGFRPHDPPQTTVVWRRHLPVQADGPFDAKSAKRFFQAAPPHTSEQLETETRLVLDWLIARASAKKPEPSKTLKDLLDKRSVGADLSVRQQKELTEYDKQLDIYGTRPREQDVVAVLLTSRGEVRGAKSLRELQVPPGENGKKAREQVEDLLGGATLVVDARLGGIKDGLLDPQATATAEASDDSSTTWLALPDVPDVPVTGFRIRALGAGKDEPAWRTTPGAGWVRRHLFVTSVEDGEPSAALVIDGWAGDAATEEERGEADRPQQLDEHQNWAEECARQIARRLGVEQRRADLLALAARLHDEGKRAARWQRAFNAPKDWGDGRPYAKTKGPIDFDLLDGYRHELGSLPNVDDHDDFKALSSVDQDFVLHLIAAHHGFARPVIGTSGCDDAPPSVVEERARAVALRFARLSRQWGPWGLAWWEALLRAADQAASRRNQQPAAAQKERA